MFEICVKRSWFKRRGTKSRLNKGGETKSRFNKRGETKADVISLK